ncbi:ATP-binding protein [Sphaerisporangium melleum]|uniref:ATP-binding protein n=1 Tax=Sphaerisporangium melleum TaxID=321316 RepID=A0A917R3V0_9ACTN|nr:ATP/GTP-binding protein [Sphaerisporangium melleum]GGK88915.1 ATP-binding protein [Sphaerisporangium melleum]GII67740.1 ATP-binding protein [Sphaerisporangium melleum]
MDSVRSDSGPAARANGAARTKLPTAIKILIAGGFGAGKTTMVGSVSETRPLRTEETLTDRGVGVDDLSGVEEKKTTTVAMDFGRISIGDAHVLYLFGTPGQERFWFVWDELALGAMGAVVIADTRRLADCFPSVDYFERRGTPFVVAVNCFEGARRYDLDEIRMALDLGPAIPVVLCDARQRESSKNVLVALVQHAMQTRSTKEPIAG